MIFPYLLDSSPTYSKEATTMADLNYVIANWYPTAKVADLTDLTQRTVSAYCKSGRFDAIRVGREWYVNPRSVEEFRKSNAGRKRSDE